MKIIIQSSNIYTFNRNPRLTLRRARKHSKIGRPDSIGLQEAGRAIHWGLKEFAGYRLFWKRSGNHHHRGNAVLVRKTKRHKFLSKLYRQSNNGAGTKWTPPRNIFVVTYKKRGRMIAHINTHFHVVPEEQLARMNARYYGEAASQYVRQVRQVKRLMRRYRRKGYIVFVTADGNTRPRAGMPDWKYAAYNFLSRGPWRASVRGVDLIIHDSSKVKLNRFNVVDKSVLGRADHPTLIGEYETID